MKSFLSFLLSLCFICAASSLALADDSLGQHHDVAGQHHHDVPEQLGKVSFPISCAPEVQKPFERGIALLHSFGYEEAQAQFIAVSEKDPGCAMAHWGVAMSLFHQIWDRPQEPTLKHGVDELQQAQKIGARTERERDYISALSTFYTNFASRDHLARVSAYSDAMGQLYRKYPNDLEAGAFYGLSLLASDRRDDASLANEKHAVEVLNKLFDKEPAHPGLAHYIIHACDSPQLAPMALDAARRYAQIAPASAHALHMPSHIFARLGLWQDDIEANLNSVNAAHSATAMYMHGHELHAMHFLIYAYLQTGQDGAAKQMVDDSRRIIARAPKAMPDDDMGMMEYFGFAAAHFPAIYALEMHHWNDAAALDISPEAPPHLQAITYWARTIGAARIGDLEATRQNANKFDEAREAIRKTKYAYMLKGPQTEQEEVHAWLAFAEHKPDEAVHAMRQVADTQDKVGKAEVDVPAREMLGDMLLSLKKSEQALAEYEKSMQIDPNRFNGLAGAALAAQETHQMDKANSYYAQLLKNCSNGKNSARPELSQARTTVAKGY